MKSLGNNTCQNNPPDNATKSMLPVVGIGASAGGLDALQSFFAHVPSSTGLAFIVVTHQKSEHVSLLPELLKKYTTMQIITAEDGMHLNSNCVFICPPGKNLALYNQHLRLKETGKFDATNLPIDTFFRSLADVAQEMSIGIILSGTGTDGTLGLKAIKGASGMTMVQDPKTAKFDGMPSYAMAMVDVDFVLPTEKMGQQLVEYVKGPYFNRMHTVTTGTILATPLIQKILTLLRNRTGHDLALYKPMTIQRRIIRRMNIHQIKNPDKYLEFLQENPVEVDKLFKELLINVTSFFRDSAAFETLSDEILPKLFASKPDNDELRVWVTG